MSNLLKRHLLALDPFNSSYQLNKQLLLHYHYITIIIIESAEKSFVGDFNSNENTYCVLNRCFYSFFSGGMLLKLKYPICKLEKYKSCYPVRSHIFITSTKITNFVTPPPNLFTKMNSTSIFQEQQHPQTHAEFQGPLPLTLFRVTVKNAR